jgi:lipid-binding SYLF domain-containing protein
MSRILFTFMLISAALLLSACSTAPKSEGAKLDLRNDAEATLTKFKTADPSLQEFFDNAAGWAVFPSVGKGAVGVGGAYGRGVVYENREMIGYADLTQGSIGLQLGGQAYSELIFFQNASALEDFKAGKVAFAAQASAVAVTAGASADAAYEGGVAVFTMTKGGLMYEASIGGQGFDYVSK